MDPLVIAQAVVGPHVLLKAEHTHGWRTKPFNGRWKALNVLYDRFVSIYEKQLKRMREDLLSYAESEADLKKADGSPMLTPAQVEALAQIIRDHHTALSVVAGAGPANTDEVQRLIDSGVLPPESLHIVKDSYLYGRLLASLQSYDGGKGKKLSYDAFKRTLKRKPIPLTEEEEASIAWAEHGAGTYIRGLGNRVADDFTRTAIEADNKLRQKYEKVIREEVVGGFARRESWREVVSNIGHKSGDWARDLGRIAATEMQAAHQEGFARGLVKREDDDPENIMVAKIPSGDACKHCVRLHLTGGQGTAPRIFRLSELINNGTNVGRKAAEWKAIVGPVHPWCGCSLIHVPPGWSFEEQPDPEDGYTLDANGRWKRSKKNPSRAYDAPPTIDEYWTPSLVPDSLRRGGAFERDLKKAVFTYQGGSVPDTGVSVRVSDPEVAAAVQKVIEVTPEHLFDRRLGVTLVTTDIARVGSALDTHDLAYWTGNEVRLSQTIDPEKVDHTLKHELGHSLNVYLMHSLGDVGMVRKWHDKLYRVSAKEGFVSKYAKTLPIENAAEVTRMYLYERQQLMLKYPRQFAFVHRYYRPILRPGKMATGYVDEEQFNVAAKATREADR